MARHKFVSAKRPSDFADQLHQKQIKIAKLEATLKVLRAEAEHLETFLLQYSGGRSFAYNAGDGYTKIVKVSNHSRMILDQAKVQKLLKSRTPYKPSNWTTVTVDWQYE